MESHPQGAAGSTPKGEHPGQRWPGFYVAYISEFGLIGFLSFLLLIFASYKNVMNTPYKNVRQIGILFLLWFFIGSFSDTVIWREIIVVPFLIFMSAIPSIKQEL
jgi:hypothetical protein